MRLLRMYIHILSFAVSACMLIAPSVVLAKTSNPPSSNPSNNSFNSSGYDKSSSALYSSYQQRRLGAQTPVNKGANLKSPSANASSKSLVGRPHSAIKKIAFHSSTPAKATSATPTKTTSTTPTKTTTIPSK